MAEGTVTLPVVSQSRAPAGQVEVPAAVVAGPVREHLLHTAVQSQLAGRRAGTIFGPQPRDYAYRLPKTARRAALRAALASRHTAGTLLVVGDLRLPEPKTKRMIECLRGLGLEGASVLIVLAQADAAIQRAARNLPHVKVLVAQGLNVYDVLGHTHLVLTRAALEAVAGRLGGRA